MTEQAHREVFYGAGAIQLGDIPNKAGGAYLLRGEALVVWDKISQEVCNLGGGGGSPGTR